MTNIEVTTCYSNKFKNKKTPNHNDVFSMKAGQIETQHNAEKQKEINYETKGNGKYIEDGILGRAFGINTIPAETELNKYDMISYNYGYYDASNVRIIPILCEGKIPERLNRAIAIAIDKKTIDKSLVGELYPEDLLSDIGRRDAYFMKYFHNIEPINQDYTFLEGYNSALQVFTKEEMLDTHTFKKGYNYAEAMLKLGNIPERYKEEPAKKHR